MTENYRPELTPFAGPEHQPYRLGSGTHGIMLIHGFPGTAAETRSTAELMTRANDWTAYGLLLPGYGPQIADLHRFTRHDWLDYARSQWQNVCEKHDKTVLLGFSMGGAIAITLAAERPPSHLVLVAPFYHVPVWITAAASAASLVIRRVRPFRRADFSDTVLRERMAAVLPGIDPDDEDVQRIVREEFTFDSRTITEVLALGRTASKLAGTITTPVTVIQGKHDMVVRSSSTRKLLNKLAAAYTAYYEIDGEHNIIGQNGTQNRLVADLILQELSRTL